jgi:hypothetical protein
MLGAKPSSARAPLPQLPDNRYQISRPNDNLWLPLVRQSTAIPRVWNRTVRTSYSLEPIYIR